MRQKELPRTTLKTVIFELKTLDINFKSFITRNICFRVKIQEVS